MISCFWEGQEGSFLLWMFWQSVLGLIMFRKRSEWTAPVMAVLMLAQVVLSSMLLGLPITDTYIFGSSPFELLREAKPELLHLPVMEIRGIATADYMQIISDGTGLNPLLQNYWMVIHPPTLFFGFASTIIPFAFAVAGLWKKKYTEWIRPAMPWALMAAMVLGTGIIMGGIWAYESLSFGGYWAWDPVENASLVPWIILIAGIHVMHLNRNSGQSLILTYLLIISSYILVLYATFLTRSGILGDTSVHSFTDLGLSRQLLVFLFMFMLLPAFASFKEKQSRLIAVSLGIAILVLNVVMGQFLLGVNALYAMGLLVLMLRNFNRNMPLSKKEESIYSREFWMFIGALILVLSAIQVISTTSIPVMNKITSHFASFWNMLFNATNWDGFKSLAEGKNAPPQDPISHYNKWQLPMAIIIAILTGFAQFMRYRDQKSTQRFKYEFLGTLGAALVLSLFIAWVGNVTQLLLVLLLFAAMYTIVGNLYFIFNAWRGKLYLAGGSIAHIGFGLMLIGVLFSGSQKQVISLNNRVDFGDNFSEKEARENILLYKDESVQMDKYMVTYRGDSSYGPDNFYKVDYVQLETGETFTLYPNAQMSREMGLTANPDTRHYLTHDIFTHVSSVPNKLEPKEEWTNEQMHDMKLGDTVVVNRHLVILKDIQMINGSDIAQDLAGHEMQVAVLAVVGMDSTRIAKPLFGVKDGLNSYNVYSYVEQARLRFNYFPEEVDGEIVHRIESAVKPKDYIIMKAIVFPLINLLWTGMIILVIGFVMAIRQRRTKKV
jgi:cytochrome c-type biogenesis protein CcmF